MSQAMWLRNLVVVVLLAIHGSASDYECGTNPGESAGFYEDGIFTVPNGNMESFSVGTMMNISWTTEYTSMTLWLITGCDFARPTRSLVTGYSGTFFQWEVSTTSTNSSQVYLFRIVNDEGTTDDLLSGGFLSATFRIFGGPSSSASSASPSSTGSLSTNSRHAATSTSGSISVSTGSSSAISPPNLYPFQLTIRRYLCSCVS